MIDNPHAEEYSGSYRETMNGQEIKLDRRDPLEKVDENDLLD